MDRLSRRSYEIRAVSYAVGRIEDRMVNIIHSVAADRQAVRTAVNQIRAELAKYRQQLVDAIVKFRAERVKFAAGQITKAQLLDALHTLRATVRQIISNIVLTLHIALKINLNPVPLPSLSDLRSDEQKRRDDLILARNRPAGVLPGGTLPPMEIPFPA